MRIGMVTAVYKPIINGVTRMVSLYRQHLEAVGHEVYIFTLGDPHPEDEERVIRSPGYMVGDYGYMLTMRYTREAQALMRKMDIIHSHHLLMGVEMAHRYGRCPVIYTNHTRYDLYAGAYTSIPQSATDVLMRQIWPELTDYADVVIAPSESMRRVMLDFGVRRPIEVIENGVELRPFLHPPHPLGKADLGVPETAVLFTYVGRLSPEKNLDLLLQQFAIARDILPELHLMLVGGGVLQENLEKQTRELGLGDAVHFTGAVPFENIPNYMAAADLFVTASVTEVHPLTVIEAMAAGLPIAAVVSPGIVDTVVPGETGLLTTRLEGGLAAIMVGLALNPEQRRRMGRNAAAASRRYAIENTVARTLALYEKLRRERPDLQRDKPHGSRWYHRGKLRPVANRLGRWLRPSGKPNSARRWLPDALTRRQNNQQDQWHG